MLNYDPRALRDAFPTLQGVEPVLRSTMNYALRTEGGLGRAQLAQTVGIEQGLALETAADLGTAIELLHLASLLIDDLPCMDDAATRRSRPCAHSVFGESAAVLSALAFITRGYALLWKRVSQADSSAREEAGALVEECLGVGGILNGQALDLGFGATDRSPDVVERVAQLKTGALLRLCLLLPSVLAGASRYEKYHLTRLAQAWGLAYQIADDLKDVLFSEQVSGKTPRRDEELNRPNMAIALGIEDASEILHSCIHEAATAIAVLETRDGNACSSLEAFQQALADKAAPILARQAVA